MSALLRTKRIVWAVVFFFALLVLSFSYVSGRKYMNALKWVEHTQTVTLSLERLLSGVRQQESGTRGYVITGDPTFLAEREVGVDSLEQELAHLRALVRDNPEQVARAAELARRVHDKLTLLADGIALRHQSPELSRAFIASRQGKVQMDRVRFSVGAMRGEEERLLEQRRVAAARTQHQTMAAMSLLGVGMLTLLFGAFFNMQRDAHELRQTAADLAESEERYRVLVDNVTDLVTLHGKDGKLLFVSPSVVALLGYGREEAATLSPFALLHPEDTGTARYNLQKFDSGEARTGVVTCRLRRRDGEYRWFEFRVTRVDDEAGEFRHIQAAGRDVTVRRQLEQRLAVQAEELRNLSLRDGLTGLYNRRGFLELSAQLVRVAERERHPLALLFVDLDGLKEVNDRLGHGCGDRAISEMAELLRSTCRATDLVARLGGDEFVVLAANVEDDSIGILTARLERALAQANDQVARDYQLSYSLGIARFDPGSPVPIETLLGEADARMYEAKARRERPRSRPAATPLCGVA